jgi:hypothetical protein
LCSCGGGKCYRAEQQYCGFAKPHDRFLAQRIIGALYALPAPLEMAGGFELRWAGPTLFEGHMNVPSGSISTD